MEAAARDRNFFEGFIQAVENEELGVYGIHVHTEGRPPLFWQFREDERVHLYSGSKAFTSMAVGIAEGEGLLSLEDRALDYFPAFQYVASPGSEEITVRDLLHMCAGREGSLFTTDVDSHNQNEDWAGLFFARETEWTPGARFYYDNGSTYMLSRIIEEVSGATLVRYLMPRLFRPLGIAGSQWHTCPMGHSLGAVGLHLKTEEFSRLGRLLLQNGVWEGKRLIPESYIRRASEDLVETHGFEDTENNCGYGYQLWRCTIPGAFRADGKFGQYSIVLPEQRAVVTVTAHNEKSANDILRAVWKEVLPSIAG
jgi:CubicO group peptidase (beta-lactamase class C family)